MLKIAEMSCKSEELKQKILSEFQKQGIKYNMENDEDKLVRLVFAGQYSAGKSSILKMLTGIENIAIGGGITTQSVYTYSWNGIEVIDTPGIHTELRPDHDEISYRAIASADMLVFVVTNELFDSYMAEHFRKIAIEKDKAGEMILVVNKMDRAAEGNTIEQQNIIKEDLKKVLEPYSSDQFRLCFLDAESYLDGIEEKEDAEIADELIKRSGYDRFVEVLNNFVEEKSISSKLTTDLYELDSVLEAEIKKLQPSSDNTDIDALEENYRQQRHVIVETRGMIQREVGDLFSNAASSIRDIGLDAANLLSEGCEQKEIEIELEKAICKADDIIEKCQIEATEIIEQKLHDIDRQLEIIENSDFSVQLKNRLERKIDGLPEGIKKIITSSSGGFQKAGKMVLDKAYKTGAQGGLKLTNFSGSSIHQTVLKVGHKLKFKFKPWQAVKITRGIAIGGQVLSVLGVGLSIFMQIKSDQDEQKLRENLRINRQNIRSQFNSAASELEAFGKKYFEDTVNIPLIHSISEMDEKINEIRNSRQNRSDNCRKLEKLQDECRFLIKYIHMQNE